MQRSGSVKVAPPKNRNNIRKDAFNLRRKLGIEPRTYVDILKVLELVLPRIDHLFHLVPVDDDELYGCSALTVPIDHVIYVKQSVYLAADEGEGWARMVLAHEWGHYVYHGPANVAFARIDQNEKIHPDIDPERQAEIFAAEFLVPSGELKGMNQFEVSNAYGVSMKAAENQIHQAENLVRRQRKKRPSKKLDRWP